jgi:hypothetical protein
MYIVSMVTPPPMKPVPENYPVQNFNRLEIYNDETIPMDVVQEEPKKEEDFVSMDLSHGGKSRKSRKTKKSRKSKKTRKSFRR